jgi:galactoside O-acetyltransferase
MQIGEAKMSILVTVYANFNLTLVDDCDIFVGDNVMFGPNVTISAGTHPIHPNLRRKKAQYNVPIYIEDNVWIGAQSVVLPGVHIGENTVIGAGSVVTKSIPANVVAVGNPCRVIREINDRDMKYYYKDLEIDIE